MIVKIAIRDELPVPVFIAQRDIPPLTELSYNYGGAKYDWRQKGR